MLLCLVQDNEMVLSVVHRLVTQTLTNWQSSDICDVELAVTLLYQLGEALPVKLDAFLVNPWKNLDQVLIGID